MLAYLLNIAHKCVFFITNEMQLIKCSFIIRSAVHVSGGFRPSSGAYKNCMCSLGCCHAFLLSTAGVGGLEVPTHPHQR